MVQIAGKYKFEKSENLVEYFKAAGIPVELAQKLSDPGSITEITIDEKKITFNNTSVGTNLTIPFGEEFSEPIPGSTLTLKSKAKKEGDAVTITSTTPDGKTGSRRYEFSDAGFQVHMTTEGITAKRYHTRI